MDGRRVWGRIGSLVAFALLVGVVAYLLWAGLSELPSWVVQADGHATITDREMAQAFSSDFWFAALGAIGGLVIGTAAWTTLRRVGWPVAVVAVLCALLAGLICLLAAGLFGPGAFATRLANARAGDTVSQSLRLGSPSALAVWAFTAAMVPLFAASLGPEVDREDRARHPEVEKVATDAVS